MQLDSDVFWTNINGIYQLKYKNEHNIALVLPSLPSFPRYREPELKTLKIYYEDNGSRLITYNPNVVEWEAVTAPIIKLNGLLVTSHHLGYHTGNFPTAHMLKVANNYFLCAKQRLEDFILEKESAEFDQYFESHSLDGISCWWNEDDYAILSSENMDEKYYLFNLAPSGHPFEGLAIFRKALKVRTTVTITVPKCYVSKLIGKNASTIKKLSDGLGLSHIKVKAENEN